MGLCKCRVVTNLFCFEHKTNVCEKCIVATHPRCVVKSYLSWLQDSDFDASCGLCRKTLQEGDVVRLACLDLFHRSCLDQYATAMPDHTAPSGYTCPACGTVLIPPENAASPVSTNVRQIFRTSAWAKPILGIQEAVAHPNVVFDSTLSMSSSPSSRTSQQSEGSPSATSATAPEKKGPIAATSSSLAGQAVSSRKQPASALSTATNLVQQQQLHQQHSQSGTDGVSIPEDADEQLHKYKQRRGYFTRLLQMTFWHLNNQGDLVLNIPRLLLFLFFVSILLVVGFLYTQQTAASPLIERSIVKSATFKDNADDDLFDPNN